VSLTILDAYILSEKNRFGESFKMLETGSSHRFMTILHRFMKSLSVLSAVPWITSLMNLLPAGADIKEFEKIASDMVNKRRAKGSTRKDIFYYLLGEDKETGSRLNERELVMDSRTAIVGGSDTTSISLGYVTYKSMAILFNY
jgi:cytochrome P450